MTAILIAGSLMYSYTNDWRVGAAVIAGLWALVP